jgi:hypothetical protein
MRPPSLRQNRKAQNKVRDPKPLMQTGVESILAAKPQGTTKTKTKKAMTNDGSICPICGGRIYETNAGDVFCMDCGEVFSNKHNKQ